LSDCGRLSERQLGVSITSPVPDKQGVAHSAVGLTCFYCGESTTDPALHWAGATGDVYVHPACWPRWNARMWRDYHELENPGYYARRGLR
jgi:hypothetical protein